MIISKKSLFSLISFTLLVSNLEAMQGHAPYLLRAIQLGSRDAIREKIAILQDASIGSELANLILAYSVRSVENPYDETAYIDEGLRNDIVRFILQKGANPNWGGFALSRASLLRYPTIVKTLLDAGANPDQFDNQYGSTPLINVVSFGAPDETDNRAISIIKMLLAQQASVDQKNKSGSTALHYAVENGNPDFITLLLEAGADINAQNNKGKTPLMVAADMGRRSAVQLLIDKGADIELKDAKHATALDYAARSEIKELLEESLCNKNIASKL